MLTTRKCAWQEKTLSSSNKRLTYVTFAPPMKGHLNVGRKIMVKMKENILVDWTDDIILLNDNYADKGLYTGYVWIL